MTSYINAKEPASRALLRWVSEKVSVSKVTEVLKNRVEKIETEGDSEGFSLRLLLTKEDARKTLEANRKVIEELLKKGFQEQAELKLTDVFFALS